MAGVGQEEGATEAMTEGVTVDVWRYNRSLGGVDVVAPLVIHLRVSQLGEPINVVIIIMFLQLLVYKSAVSVVLELAEQTLCFVGGAW